MEENARADRSGAPRLIILDVISAIFFIFFIFFISMNFLAYKHNKIYEV